MKFILGILQHVEICKACAGICFLRLTFRKGMTRKSMYYGERVSGDLLKEERKIKNGKKKERKCKWEASPLACDNPKKIISTACMAPYFCAF